MASSTELIPISRVRCRCFAVSLWILAFFFVCGCLIGCFWGGNLFYFDSPEEYFLKDNNVGLFINWLYLLWPNILVLFFSSSLYGWILIPALFLARGVSAASAVSRLISAGGYRAHIPAVLFCFGFLPLCALFAAGEGCFICSYCLFRSYDHGIGYIQSGLSNRIPFVFFLSFLSALFQHYIVPFMI